METDNLLHIAIEPTKLQDRCLAERDIVSEMLVTINDHSELSAPVSKVIIGDRFMT